MLRLAVTALSLFVATAAASDQMACLTMTVYNDPKCKDAAQTAQATVPTAPLDTCLPVDNPSLGPVSVNHEYCDMLKNYFHETVYLGTKKCDPNADGVQVFEQNFDNNACYSQGPQSVMSVCSAGPCSTDENEGAVDIHSLKMQRHLVGELEAAL